MITLSIQEMYPKAIKYNEKKFVVYGLFMGILIIIINLFLH